MFIKKTQSPTSVQPNGTNAGKQESNGHLPVHGVQRMRLVVVSPLVMSHVDRHRRVEGGEEMVGGCGSRGEESRMSERARGDIKKGEKFQRSNSAAARISEQAEHFPVTYWLYQTGEVE